MKITKKKSKSNSAKPVYIASPRLMKFSVLDTISRFFPNTQTHKKRKQFIQNVGCIYFLNSVLLKSTRLTAFEIEGLHSDDW